MLTAIALSLALFSTNPAAAQTAAVDATQASEEIIFLAAEVARLEAAVKAAEEAKAKCTPPVRRPAAKKPAPAPATTTATPPAPPAAEDTALAEALAALETVRADLAAAKADLEAKTATPASPEVKVTVELSEIQIPTPSVTFVRGNPTHLIGYAGAGLVLGATVPDVSGPVASRIVSGVRPSWDMGDNFQLGITAEGSYESLGLGVRGIASFIITGKTGEWSGGGGVGWACNVWIGGEGCMAQYYGADVRGTWSTASGPLGPMVFLDVEFGGLSASGQSEPAEALRVVTGLTLRLGNAHPKKVSTD